MSTPLIATQAAVSSTAKISDVLPILPILSSEQRAWKGIVIEQRCHPPSEIIVPAVTEHIITLQLKHSTNLTQVRDGRVHEALVTKGHISLTPAGEPSNWRWDKTSEVIHLRLDPIFLLKVATEECEIDSHRVELLSYFSTRDVHLEQIGLALLGELHSNSLGGKLYAESLVNLLAVHLLRHYSAFGQTIHFPAEGCSNSQIKQVIEYIHDNLSQSLALTNLAQIAGLSSSRLTYLFKQAIGVAPHQYVIQCRVAQAKQLLMQSRLSISEVASHVGFYDQSHLTYHMKRLIGVTPKAIRQDSKNVLKI